MVWLYVVLAVAGVITLLSVSDIRIEFKYTDSLKIYGGYGLVKLDVVKLLKSVIRMNNRKKNKKADKGEDKNKSKSTDSSDEDKPDDSAEGEKKSGQESTENKTDDKSETDSSLSEEESETKTLEKEKGLFKKALSRSGSGGLIDVIIDIITLISGLGTSVRKHLIISRCDFSYTVTGEDSAKTANKYGIICATAYTVYALMTRVVNIKKFRTAIEPDFLGKKSKGEIHIVITYKLFWIVALALKGLFGYIKVNSGAEQGVKTSAQIKYKNK